MLYDPHCLVTSSQDALGQWSYMQYDGAGKAVPRTDPRGWVTAPSRMTA